MGNAWTWLNENAGGIGLVLASAPLLWTVWTFLQIKRVEKRQLRFANYHTLIKWVLEGENRSDAPYIDRQLAAVFELQKYRDYRAPSIRILQNFRRLSEQGNALEKVRHLLEQIDETLAVLGRRRWWERKT